MKNIISVVFVAILVMFQPVHAEESIIVEDEKWKYPCESIYSLAYQLMRSRQIGVPMPEVMRIAEGDIAPLIVRDAYRSPRYNLAKNREEAMVDFANKWYGGCLDATQ